MKMDYCSVCFFDMGGLEFVSLLSLLPPTPTSQLESGLTRADKHGKMGAEPKSIGFHWTKRRADPCNLKGSSVMSKGP